MLEAAALEKFRKSAKNKFGRINNTHLFL